MIPQEFLDQLVDRLDIVEVVSRYIPLKRSGQNFTACCPFHNEKTPSFTVNAHKQFYHCFGCGAHGNALRFIMEHTGAPFIETVTQLAQQAGLEVPSDPRSGHSSAPERQAQRDAHEAAYTLLQSVTRFYCDQLAQAIPAQRYLEQRGVNAESQTLFQVGYAAGRVANSLVSHFSTHHNALKEQGLLLTRERDQQLYDRFRDRLMFPIHDSQGRCVGFGGRGLDDATTPKYLNSPETPLFNKSRLLYGLHHARPHFRTAQCAIVVEGYLDVIMLHQHGAKNAVATLGTALNADHLKLLFRYTETIVFSFDGDTAGKKAAQRALEQSLSVIEDGQTIKFLFLPDNHDPDSFVRAHGIAAFQQHVDQAPLLSEVWIQHWLTHYPPTHAESRAALWKNAKNDLNALVQAPLLARFLREALNEKMGEFNRPQRTAARPAHASSFSASSKFVAGGRKTGTRRPEFMPTEESLAQPRPRPSWWRNVLDLALFAPHLLPQIPKPLDHHTEPEARALHALLSLGLPLPADFNHPSLMPYQTLLKASQERLKSGSSDFDAQAELQALLHASHSPVSKASAQATPLPASPTGLSEAEKARLLAKIAQKKPPKR